METYSWLETTNGKELLVFAEELKEKFNNLSIGESSAMLGSAMAASMRRKAIELDISPDEAIDFYFYTVMNKNMTQKK
ncbi:MAG TPA: hypothetical protein VN365_04435 [Candidatus Thermoplasmatota archaeon]|jgi:hypothetical protein|nr:hypothetical protein [Candidatus Thermoplasmatota archaeon]